MLSDDEKILHFNHVQGNFTLPTYLFPTIKAWAKHVPVLKREDLWSELAVQPVGEDPANQQFLTNQKPHRCVSRMARRYDATASHRLI